MTTSRPGTLLVVPCFNEARRLATDDFVAAVDRWPWLRLLFVDDGSTDETGPLLRRLAASHERVEVLTLAENRGKAGAVHAGLTRGLGSDAEVLGYWDGDLAAPLFELDGLLAELVARDAFLVLGSRVRLLGRVIRRSPARHYLGRVFATCASLVLGLPVYDTQCGAKLLRNGGVAREILAEPFTSRWIFDVELLARIRRYDRRHGTRLCETAVVEVPLRQWVHVDGSKLTAGDGVRAALDLYRIARRR